MSLAKCKVLRRQDFLDRRDARGQFSAFGTPLARHLLALGGVLLSVIPERAWVVHAANYVTTVVLSAN